MCVGVCKIERGKRERERDGEMERWRERWRDGEMERERERWHQMLFLKSCLECLPFERRKKILEW